MIYTRDWFEVRSSFGRWKVYYLNTWLASFKLIEEALKYIDSFDNKVKK